MIDWLAESKAKERKTGRDYHFVDDEERRELQLGCNIDLFICVLQFTTDDTHARTHTRILPREEEQTSREAVSLISQTAAYIDSDLCLLIH